MQHENRDTTFDAMAPKWCRLGCTPSSTRSWARSQAKLARSTQQPAMDADLSQRREPTSGARRKFDRTAGLSAPEGAEIDALPLAAALVTCFTGQVNQALA
jgi:hypothetical protein